MSSLDRSRMVVPGLTVVVVVALFVLWLAPSTDSWWVRRKGEVIAAEHRVELGLLRYVEGVAVRTGLEDSWSYRSDVDAAAFGRTLAVSLPVLWLGWRSLRRFRNRLDPAPWPSRLTAKMAPPP